MLPFVFVSEFKIRSKVDLLLHARISYTSQFRIPKFILQISEFGIHNSEFRIRNCEIVWKRKECQLSHRRSRLIDGSESGVSGIIGRWFSAM